MSCKALILAFITQHFQRKGVIRVEEEKFRLPVSVCGSKTSVLKLAIRTIEDFFHVDINTRGVGRIRDSYASPRRSEGSREISQLLNGVWMNYVNKFSILFQ